MMQNGARKIDFMLFDQIKSLETTRRGPAGALQAARAISWWKTFWVVFSLASSFAAILPQPACAKDAEWIRPENDHQPMVWGRSDGILFGLPSDGGLPGPRGLIRVGVLSSTTGKPQLLNFIAIEPVAAGPGSRSSRMAFSELELSTLDGGLRGKRLWVGPNASNGQEHVRGNLSVVRTGTHPIERLTVEIDVERFTANGAHVHVTASIDSDRPGELNLAVHQYDDSPPVEELTLTATMGNFERLRWLFLKDRTVESKSLFGGYTGDDFVEYENYPLEEMLRVGDGDAVVYCTSDEPSPSSATPAAKKFWYYSLPRLTQYWKVPARDIEPDLRVKVNGRRVYWASHDPLPSGIAYENFEVRQRYHPGQTFTFGVSATEPWDFRPTIPRLQRPANSASLGKSATP